jgi:hypothetical protein
VYKKFGELIHKVKRENIKILWVIKWLYIGYKVLQAVYECRILCMTDAYSYLNSRIYFTPILWRTVPLRTLSESGFKIFLTYQYKTSRPLTSINNGTGTTFFPNNVLLPSHLYFPQCPDSNSCVYRWGNII